MTDALVVGAGWAGLAAAVGLVESGRRVTVLEAAAEPGGRARSQSLRFGETAVEVDNGQHLLVGAYRSTLALIRRVGVDPASVLHRQRLRLTGPDGFEMRAAPLPAPLHVAAALLGARGFPWSERAAAVRAMAALALGGAERIPSGTTVTAWLARHRQPQALVARLWAPLCVGALNTTIERACARAFARVLTDVLLADAADADFLMPRRTLGDVLPRPAAAWLREHGAMLRWRTACRALEPTGSGWRARTDAGVIEAPQVVTAVPPPVLARLLEGAVPAARLAPLGQFEHEPIGTVWLAWHERLELPDAVMLAEDRAAGAYGQWLFGREPPGHGPVRSVAGVVVSTAASIDATPQALAEAVGAQVCAQLGLPPAAHARAVIERRATIRCTPDRPQLDTDAFDDVAPGLAIAGDWVWHRYPATIESAVRSGDAACARLDGRPLLAV